MSKKGNSKWWVREREMQRRNRVHIMWDRLHGSILQTYEHTHTQQSQGMNLFPYVDAKSALHADVNVQRG